MQYGTLEVICGPMFSGKSTQLLRKSLCARALEKKNILILAPAFDTRYGVAKVTNHDGLTADALAISEWQPVPDGTDVVFIDEVQFFKAPNFAGDIIAEVKNLLRRGINVVACGLDADWQGDAFEVTAKLMAMADHVEKRSSICTACGQPASKSMKKVRNAKVVELGESDLYEARCNRHWLEMGTPAGMNQTEAA